MGLLRGTPGALVWFSEAFSRAGESGRVGNALRSTWIASVRAPTFAPNPQCGKVCGRNGKLHVLRCVSCPRLRESAGQSGWFGNVDSHSIVAVACGLSGESGRHCGKQGDILRTFFADAATEQRPESSSAPSHGGDSEREPGLRARIAVYDASPSAPRVVDVDAPGPTEFIGCTADTVYTFAREAGGSIPYSAIREVVENFIHAGFREPVVSVLDSGSTIRFADQGPGISDKSRAVMPGFTTATSDMKCHIRGVGSGLPIVQDYLAASGGVLSIDDNLGRGCVVTISGARMVGRTGDGLPAADHPVPPPSMIPASVDELPGIGEARAPLRLSGRQKRVLALVMEAGSAGPSIVARELSIALSTAHRDLAWLENLGLIESDADGKRSLTDTGIAAADELLR